MTTTSTPPAPPASSSAALPPLPELCTQLEHTLKLRVPPIGIQLLETAEELQAIARLRRPKAVHTMDQIVGQATRLGWTVGSPPKTWWPTSAASSSAWARMTRPGTPART